MNTSAKFLSVLVVAAFVAIGKSGGGATFAPQMTESTTLPDYCFPDKAELAFLSPIDLPTSRPISASH